MAEWAAEKAKIELSQKSEAYISLADSDLCLRDLSGKEIYVDIAIDRVRFDALISSKVDESIRHAQETLKELGFSPHDIDRIIFVGGPTQYRPLRDKVSLELGISQSTEVNPMTAVAEGAAVFAESIDWSSRSRGRKGSRGALTPVMAQHLTFNYIARTPDLKARIVAKFTATSVANAEFQIVSLDSGWSSGRMPLVDGAGLELALANPGANAFKVTMFDSDGAPISLHDDKIVITRTAATVDAIPASHSIGIEALEKLDGPVVVEHLIRKGEQLPKKGKTTFKAEESKRSRL